MVYFDTADISGTGTPLFHKLDTSLGTITDLDYPGLAAAGNDEFDRVLLSPDGSKVYSSEVGGTTISFWLNTSNDQISFSGANYLSSGFPDLAISGDGSTVDAGGELTDSFLNPLVQTAYVDWETWFPIAANGQKLSQDGSLLLQPLTDGIDLLARNTGRLLYRIQIPVTPANVYDTLVVAPGQNTLAVISADAVSFVDLSALPIAAKYARPFASSHHSNNRSSGDKATVSQPKVSFAKRAIHWPMLKREAEHAIGHPRHGHSR